MGVEISKLKSLSVKYTKLTAVSMVLCVFCRCIKPIGIVELLFSAMIAG